MPARRYDDRGVRILGSRTSVLVRRPKAKCGESELGGCPLGLLGRARSERGCQDLGWPVGWKPDSALHQLCRDGDASRPQDYPNLPLAGVAARGPRTLERARSTGVIVTGSCVPGDPRPARGRTGRDPSFSLHDGLRKVPDILRRAGPVEAGRSRRGARGRHPRRRPRPHVGPRCGPPAHEERDQPPVLRR